MMHQEPEEDGLGTVIRCLWRESNGFRWLAVGALIYFGLRLAMQMALLLDPASQEIAADLQTYVNAARAFQQHQDLYLKGALTVVNFYQYAPFYALAFTPFLLLSPLALAIVHTLLHVAVYMALYWLWGRIFAQLRLPAAQRWMAWSLPIWAVFSAFWGDLSYLNIYLIVALLACLLLEAVLNERLGWSALWLVIILQVKPQWAFAALVPLLVGRRGFFFKLVGLALLGYAGTLLLSVAVGGAYAWRQYLDYFQFLPRLSANFPWRGPESGFLGYNHSVKQVVLFWLGVSPGTLLLANVIKVVILVPLGMIVLAHLTGPSQEPVLASTDPARKRRFLELSFALYLAAFLWLDMVWELSLGLPVFIYLLSALRSRLLRGLAWTVFLLYALLDLWQILSYLVFGSQILIQDAYIATDPSIYAPVILFVIILFYGILVERLGAETAWPWGAVKWKLKHS